MKRLGLFVSLTALALVAVHNGGCAAGTAPFGPVGDAALDAKDSGLPKSDGSGVDTKLPGEDTSTTPTEDTALPTTRPTPSSAPTYDPGPKTKPTGAGTTYDDTVGKPCSSDTTCDVTGNGETICARGAFTSMSSLYPDPVCIGIACDIPDPTKIYQCDGINGLCLAAGTSNICLPACDFDGSSGYKPSGCTGSNVCNPYGWGTDSTTGKFFGVGYCYGGCFDDTDCPSGEKCQREEGLCKTTLDVFTKSVGESCSKGDTDCNCLYNNTTSQGYCTAFCKMGESGWCPGGYTCDAFLPKTDTTTGGTAFTKAPATMAGSCMKNCTTDADCTKYNGYCEENAGTGRKTCQPGTR